MGYPLDRHLRIDEDGAVATLAAVSDGVMYDPDIPGDRERAERERKEADDPLIADLKQKGLWQKNPRILGDGEPRV